MGEETAYAPSPTFLMSRSKFNVSGDKSSRTCNGIVFDSAVEMRYYAEVVLPGVEDGSISAYELQKSFELQPKFKHGDTTVRPILYVADFYIEYTDGRKEVIDIKGFPDSVAKLKRKLFWYIYPEITYKWLSYVKKYDGWIEYDERVKRQRELKKQKEKNDEEENDQEN